MLRKEKGKIKMKTKYIASCSGGKDSTANIILAYENNEPLDLIIFSEVMYDKNISGELPEHIEFIKMFYFQHLKVGGIKQRYYIQIKPILIVLIK